MPASHGRGSNVVPRTDEGLGNASTAKPLVVRFDEFAFFCGERTAGPDCRVFVVMTVVARAAEAAAFDRMLFFAMQARSTAAWHSVAGRAGLAVNRSASMLFDRARITARAADASCDRRDDVIVGEGNSKNSLNLWLLALASLRSGRLDLCSNWRIASANYNLHHPFREI